MKDKEFYTPIETARAILDAVKELSKAKLAKGEHDPKNLDKLKGAVDKFIGEEGKEMEKAMTMEVKGMPKMAVSTAVSKPSAPAIPKAPAVPKMMTGAPAVGAKSEAKAARPMAKFMADRSAKMSKAQVAPANGGPEPIKEANPAEIKKSEAGNAKLEAKVSESDKVKAEEAKNKANLHPETAPVKKSEGGKSKVEAKLANRSHLGKPHPTNRIAAPVKKSELKKEHIGFNKLKNEIAHEKHPPSDPAAVAASIGRAKYGKAGMAAKAKAGKK